MGKGNLNMYKVRIYREDDNLNPRDKMIEKITIIFVGAVVYGIFLKIVFF